MNLHFQSIFLFRILIEEQGNGYIYSVRTIRLYTGDFVLLLSLILSWGALETERAHNIQTRAPYHGRDKNVHIQRLKKKKNCRCMS